MFASPLHLRIYPVLETKASQEVLITYYSENQFIPERLISDDVVSSFVTTVASPPQSMCVVYVFHAGNFNVNINVYKHYVIYHWAYTVNFKAGKHELDACQMAI